MKLDKGFFCRKADIVAKELLGKILVRRAGGKEMKAKIVETEAYFDEKDPASRASKGDNKVSRMMREESGKILVYNVHKYNMLNFVTGKRGEAGAVLLRAVEPINFSKRTNGPGLLTCALEIDKKMHGEMVGGGVVVEDGDSDFEIIEKNRIGVSKDLKKPLRFYIKDNKFVSKK